MGAADVVPGVSGGTIAFISGIYEELISSIRAIGPDTLKALKTDGLLGAWKQANGSFLITLFAGILTSVIIMVRPITHLLDNQPVLIWAFFFGLIVASILLVAKKIRRWNITVIMALVVGAGISLFVGMSSGTVGNEAPWFIFGAGALAICAMILPGISGAFILLLLGAYSTVTGAIKDLDIKIIALFGAGCVTGLMLFSRFLSWMFKKYHDLTIALMSGFLLGSLYVVWPWKKILSVRTAHAGKPDEKVVPFLRENIMPGEYSVFTDLDKQAGLLDKDPQLAFAIALCVAGAALLVFLDRFAPEES